MQFPFFQQGSETSMAAAESVAKNAKSYRESLLAYFKTEIGKNIGMTIDEAAIMLDIQTGNASARIREMELLGLITKTKCTRITRAKKQAKIYFLKGYGHDK